MSWLVWGGFVRSVLVLHSTWLVNSASHVWGYRSHVTRDRSTNLWWVALLTYGEGWHNNHHAYQTSARHGLRWWEIDMTYLSIQVMKLCRIAYDIRLPKIRAVEPERGRGGVLHRAEPRLRPACLAFRGPAGQDSSGVQKSGPSSTAEQGTHQKRWQRRETFDCEPGELRET